jgi:hypothetical protein
VQTVDERTHLAEDTGLVRLEHVVDREDWSMDLNELLLSTLDGPADRIA